MLIWIGSAVRIWKGIEIGDVDRDRECSRDMERGRGCGLG